MLEERNSALRLFCQDKQNVAWKMHPTGQLSVFGITRFLLLIGKHDGVFVTSTIELQQEVLGLIYPYCKTRKNNRCFRGDVFSLLSYNCSCGTEKKSL